MSDSWERSAVVEEVFKEMHGIKPEVYFLTPRKNNIIKAQIVSGGKTFVQTEELERGLTKLVTLEYDGKVETFKRVYDSELRIKELLKCK